MHHCIHQRTSQIDTRTPLVVWPSAAISSTNLAEHLAFVVSTDGRYFCFVNK